MSEHKVRTGDDRMMPHFALFNCHVNDAQQRAFDVMDEWMPRAARIVRAARDDADGLMVLTTTTARIVIDNLEADECWGTIVTRDAREQMYLDARTAFLILVTLFVNGERREIDDDEDDEPTCPDCGSTLVVGEYPNEASFCPVCDNRRLMAGDGSNDPDELEQYDEYGEAAEQARR